MNNNRRSDDFFDRMFDTLLTEAAKEYDAEPEPDLPEEQDVVFSERHEKNMKKIFSAYRRKEFILSMGIHAKRIAACVGILAILSGIAVVSVDSKFCTNVKNFIFNIHDIDTDISFIDDNPNGTYAFNGIILEYIPDGFRASYTKQTDTIENIHFENDKNKFDITIRDINSGISVDTENSNFEQLNINGFECLFSETDEWRILTTHTDEKICTIRGDISRDEFIKIVQNLKIE